MHGHTEMHVFKHIRSVSYNLNKHNKRNPTQSSQFIATYMNADVSISNIHLQNPRQEA